MQTQAQQSEPAGEVGPVDDGPDIVMGGYWNRPGRGGRSAVVARIPMSVAKRYLVTITEPDIPEAARGHLLLAVEEPFR